MKYGFLYNIRPSVPSDNTCFSSDIVWTILLMLGWSLQRLSIRYIYSVSLPSVLLYVAMNVVLHGRLYKCMNIVA